MIKRICLVVVLLAIQIFIFVKYGRGQDSPLLVDDLSSIGQIVDKRTPITIGAPMPFEEMAGYYGGFYGFRGMGGVTGYSYPAYASIQPAPPPPPPPLPGALGG